PGGGAQPELGFGGGEHPHREPGSWVDALRRGGARAAADLPGSVALAAALFVAALIVAQAVVFVLVVPGLVVLAAVAVEGRARVRTGG
ncbi:MAG TPA: hypothetical protein VJT31_09420, partial [Rugosimonospora sp.]|nr:hypothetical protein [Rugosimonospora sp.]